VTKVTGVFSKKRLYYRIRIIRKENGRIKNYSFFGGKPEIKAEGN